MSITLGICDIHNIQHNIQRSHWSGLIISYQGFNTSKLDKKDKTLSRKSKFAYTQQSRSNYLNFRIRSVIISTVNVTVEASVSEAYPGHSADLRFLPYCTGYCNRS